MTALKKYQRLEATGLWRASPDDQRREVVVSIGDATLIITDTRDQPLTHWSLAAVERINPGTRPALFHPDGDTGETLELGSEEDEMIQAIETLRRAVLRARPRPGRLRLVSVILSCLSVAALAVFWVPGAVTQHTLSVVPEITRQSIGDDLLARITRMTGPECVAPGAAQSLDKMASRSGAKRIAVLPDGVPGSVALPGGLVLLHRDIVEGFEDPDVAAGYVLAEEARRAARDPLADVLAQGGVFASFRLLTTGDLSPETLDAHARQVLLDPRPPVPEAELIRAFAKAGLRSTPYAYARDPSGETTLSLIEADPMAGKETIPILSDRDWLVLQAICAR